MSDVPETSPGEQRKFAIDVVNQLRAAGFTAYWAGGCVRDRLLGSEPKDYDVATDATPPQIQEVFGHRRTLGIGAAFGVVAVLGGRRAGQIEVATFRSDAAYSDGRHPDSVTFSNDREDARRRDFTINGLFYDPTTDRVIDHVGGLVDLDLKIIRAIGDPAARLAEDKLRMLRAVRFAASLDFQLEAETMSAIQSVAGEIHRVSAERIAQEMRHMLLHPNRARAMRLLLETRLLAEVLPEALALLPDEQSATGEPTAAGWERSLRVLEHLDRPSFALALAALLLAIVETCDRETSRTGDAADRGKSPGVKIARAVGLRWKLPNKEVDSIAWLVDKEPAVAAARETAWPRLQRILTSGGIEELLALAEARAMTSGGNLDEVETCRELLAQPPEQLNPPPLVDGNDLIGHGIPTGKAYSVILRCVRDAQLDKSISNKEEALSLVDRLVAEGLGKLDSRTGDR